MTLDQIRKDAPPSATHWDEVNKVYVAIDNGTWFFGDDWIQYDKPHNLKLVEI